MAARGTRTRKRTTGEPNLFLCVCGLVITLLALAITAKSTSPDPKDSAYSGAYDIVVAQLASEARRNGFLEHTVRTLEDENAKLRSQIETHDCEMQVGRARRSR